jgi:hypothetical protein
MKTHPFLSFRSLPPSLFPPPSDSLFSFPSPHPPLIPCLSFSPPFPSLYLILSLYPFTPLFPVPNSRLSPQRSPPSFVPSKVSVLAPTRPWGEGNRLLCGREVGYYVGGKYVIKWEGSRLLCGREICY